MGKKKLKSQGTPPVLKRSRKISEVKMPKDDFLHDASKKNNEDNYSTLAKKFQLKACVVELSSFKDANIKEPKTKSPKKIDELSPRRKSNRVIVPPMHRLSRKKSDTKISLSDSEQSFKNQIKSESKKSKTPIKVKSSPKKVAPVKNHPNKSDLKKEKDIETTKLAKMKDVLENLGEFSVVERDGVLLVSLCISTEGFGHSELMVFETVTVIRITGKRYDNGKTLYFYRKVNVPHYILLSKLICMYQNGTMLIEVPLKDDYQNLPLTNQQPFILQNNSSNANISHVSETPFENCFGLNKTDENNNTSDSCVDNNNDSEINSDNKNSITSNKSDSKSKDDENQKTPTKDKTRISLDKTSSIEKMCNGIKTSSSLEPLAVNFLSSISFSPSATSEKNDSIITADALSPTNQLSLKDAESLNVAKISSVNGEEVLTLLMDVGNLFKPSDIHIKVGDDKVITVYCSTESKDDVKKTTFKAVHKRTFELEKMINKTTLKAGCTNEGLLKIIAKIAVDKTNSNDQNEVTNGCCDNTSDNGKTDHSQETIGVLIHNDVQDADVKGNTADKCNKNCEKTNDRSIFDTPKSSDECKGLEF